MYNLYYVLKKAVVNGNFMNINEWKKMVKLVELNESAKDYYTISIV